MEPYILTAEDIVRLAEQGFDTRGISAGAEAMPEEITALGVGQTAPQPTAPTAPDATMAAETGMPISMVGADGTVTAEPVGSGGIIAPPAAAPQAPTMPTTVNPNMALLAGGMPTVAGGGFMGGALGGSIEPQSTDPFEGLSRNQRMMLGFAALRDAAASLEGRDTDFFNQQLGTYEGARERERLRVQGATQNRIQGLQALAQVQQQIAMYRALGQPVPAGLVELERAVSTSLGGAAPTAGATGGAAPQADGQPVSAEAPQLDGPMPQSSDAILAEINRLSPLVGVPGMEGVEPRLAQLQRQYDTALAREEAATEAETIRSEGEQAAQQSEYYGSILDSIINDPNLEGVTGRIEGRADPEGAMGAMLYDEKEMDLLARIGQIEGSAFLQAFEGLKGGGQITEREGQAATRAITRLGTRAVGTDAYRQAAEELRRIFANSAARSRGQEIPFPDIAEGSASGGGDWVERNGVRIRVQE